jgi:three-Cys-motif partner protein
MRRHKPLDLHAVKHSTCQKCGADLRDENLDEGICAKIVSAVDGEAVRCVGPWVHDKIHFLTRYFGIFGPGMHKLWQENVHYIEVCSGSGRCINRDTAEEIDGTSLAVMNHDAYASYKTVTFFDKSPSVVMALNRRIKALRHDGKSIACKADYTQPTDLIDICLKRAPLGLFLIFLDPTDCSVPMDTVWRMSQSLRNVDFISNVATGTDANRNLKKAFAKPDSPVRKKYETFLGSDAFFSNPENIRLAKTNVDDKLRAQFRAAYQSALTKEGYRYFGVEIVRQYYDLLFASKHPTGLKFWQQAQRIRPNGQSTLDLGI